MPDIAIDPAVLRQRRIKRRAAIAIPAAANVASAEAERASLHAQLTSQMLTLQGQLAADEAQAQTAAVKEHAEGSLVDDHIVSVLEHSATRLRASEYARLAQLDQQRIAAFRESMAAQDRAAAAKVRGAIANLSVPVGA
jgi:HlyD family secretion protein